LQSSTQNIAHQHLYNVTFLYKKVFTPFFGQLGDNGVRTHLRVVMPYMH